MNNLVSKKWMVVRLKSIIRSSEKVRRIAEGVGLTSINSAKLFDTTDLDYLRILKLNNLIAYGPVSEDAFSKVFCGCLKPFAQKILAKHPGCEGGLEPLSLLYYNDLSLFKDGKIESIFRLHPARQGLKSKLKKFHAGGCLGPRPSMDELVLKMIPTHDV